MFSVVQKLRCRFLILSVTAILLLFTDVCAQKEWYFRAQTPFTVINSISVVDSLYIYLVDRYALRKTTDGGATWTKLKNNASDSPVVRFWSRNEGILISLGKTHATSDGGLTWRVVNNEYLFCNLYFSDSLNGVTFSTGSYSYTLYFGRTANGGQSWTWNNTPHYAAMKYVDQVDSLIFGVGGSITYGYPEPILGTFVTHSTNNGSTWIADSSTSDATNWTGLVVMRPSAFIAVSGYRVLMISTDGGENFIYYIQPRRIFSPGKSGDSLLYAGSDSGYIASSRDYGVTFTYTKLNTNASIKWLKITENGDGYAFADDGKFYSTVKLKFAPVGVDDLSTNLPEQFSLSQNFPNPFNPETVIRFALPEAGYVKGVVYDILGREIATLVSGEMNPGNHEVKFDAGGLASGIYVFRLEAGKNLSHIKMTVVK